ncbi:MAG: DUF6286 domain-containing protein [Pedococcus sp.]
MSSAGENTTSRHSRERATPAQEPLKAAKTPVGPGAITFVGALLSLLVIVMGAAGLQTAASAAGISTSQPWLTRLLEASDGLRPLGWMLPVGALLVLVGLWLLVAALRPRPRTAVALKAQTGVFLRPRDMARLAEHAADDLDRVAAVHARSTRNKVTVRVESTGDPGVAEGVRSAVTEQLATLKKAPRVAVQIKEVST